MRVVEEDLDYPGDPLTVEALAAKIALPEASLREHGLTECPAGVKALYSMEDGSEAGWQFIREGPEETFSLFYRGDAEITPYGLWRRPTSRNGQTLLFLDQTFDCWVAWAHGIAALGIPSSQAFQGLTQDRLSGISVLHLWRRPDRRGERFVETVRRHLEEISWGGEVYELSPPGKARTLARLHVIDAQSVPDAIARMVNNRRPAARPLRQVGIKCSEDLLERWWEDSTPIRFFVKDVIAEGSRTLLVGSPGAGKSLHALDLALRLAGGVPHWWPGEGFPLTAGTCRSKRVLYIDEETPRQELRSRIHRMATGLDLEVGVLRDHLFVVSLQDIRFPGCNSSPSSNYEHLRELVKQLRPEVLFIDAAVRVMNGSENAAEEVSYFWNGGVGDLQRAATQQDGGLPAAVVIHHAPWENSRRPRGSVDWRAGVQIEIGVSGGGRASSDWSLTWHKANVGEKRASVFPILLDDADGLRIVAGSPRSGPRSSSDSLRLRIEDTLRAHPGLSTRGIAARTGGKKTAVSTRLQEMEQEGLVHRSGARGGYELVARDG